MDLRPPSVIVSTHTSAFKTVVKYVGGLFASRRVFCWLPFDFFVAGRPTRTKAPCFIGPGEWPYVNTLVIVSGEWPDVNTLAVVPWRYIYYKLACSIHHQAVMTSRRIVLQRDRPADEHYRAPRRRRLSHSHSPNRNITSHASCTNPRGSIYQTDHQGTPKQLPYLVRGMIPETLQKLAR